jgi:multiple sugar transport system substrate-binding protein
VLPTSTFQALVADWRAANPGAAIPFTSGLMLKGSATRFTHLGGRTLVINSNTNSSDAAWKLVRFLASEPIFTVPHGLQF